MAACLATFSAPNGRCAGAPAAVAVSAPPTRIVLTCDRNTPVEPETDDYPQVLSAEPIEIPPDPDHPISPEFVGRLALRLDESGAVKRILFESGRPSQAAARIIEKKLRDWRFAPPQRKGRPVSVLCHCLYSVGQAGTSSESPSMLFMALPAYPDAMRRPAGVLGAFTLDAPQGQSVVNAPTSTSPTTPSGTPLPNIREAPRAPSPTSRMIVPDARAAPWFSGHVMVRARIDTNGVVSHVEVLRATASIFEPTAVAAALACRFYPARQAGVPIESTLLIPIPLPGELQNPPPLFLETDPRSDTAAAWDDPPRMRQVDFPIYPTELARQRIRGRASARVQLDASGTIAKVDLIESSRAEFGHALVASINRCTHDAARRGGRQLPSTILRVAVFDPKIDQTRPVEGETPAVFLPFTEDRKPVAAEGLDAPLRRLCGTPPPFDSGAGGPVRHESATIEFIVNSRGRVCEPRIVACSEPATGYAAVQAIASWLYAPPTSAGRTTPVLTRVTFASARPATQNP